jgi:hypothetical protein
MVDYFLHKEGAESNYLLSPFITGSDAFLGRKLMKEEIVEEAMGIM